MYIYNADVSTVLALSRRNSNASEIIIFLHKLAAVLEEYFKELEEESIRDNFVVMYELLDEMMDFGFPQTTESKILQEYITQESHQLEAQAHPPIALTNAVSWRSEGIRYRKNEVFLDVVESVNLLVNANGSVVRSEILGAVKMKCYLSGMPELRLGLNDKAMFETTGRAAHGKAVDMEDVKFHQCVRLSRFENDRTISFIPPDGEFELMSYRLSTQVKPLIWAEALVERHEGSRIEFMVKLKAQFKRRSTANNVEILIPVPDDADSPRFKAGVGSVSYAPEKSAMIWRIKQLAGGNEFLMRAHFGLPSVKNVDTVDRRPPLSVKFEIPYFTVSGIQVRYLKVVEKSGYQALRTSSCLLIFSTCIDLAFGYSLGALHYPKRRVRLAHPSREGRGRSSRAHRWLVKTHSSATLCRPTTDTRAQDVRLPPYRVSYISRCACLCKLSSI